jgi:choline dehydrogenase-like flavoprotein
MLLEAGPRDSHPFIHIPAAFIFVYNDSRYNWRYRSEPEPSLNNRSLVITQGKVLGGSSSINGMLHVRGQKEEFDQWARSGCTGWSYEGLLPYFRKAEAYRGKAPTDPSLRGFEGPSVVSESTVTHPLTRAFVEGAQEIGMPYVADMNGDTREGAAYFQHNVDGRFRSQPAQTYLRVARKRPNLQVKVEAMATKVLFDGRRAIGVEFEKGAHLYAADPAARGAGTKQTVTARREVILAGGAFNTPQLLMLSGIGDPAVLRRHGIEPRVELPGVGRNLQDRYEVAVVSRMKRPWRTLEGATFTKADRQYRQWAEHRDGVYTTNGAVASIVARSTFDKPVPDLFCYALIGDFRGYRPGYSEDIRKRHDALTWVVLKGRTNNRGGCVTLASPDPHVRPQVNFHYFEEGSGRAAAAEDLEAVVHGIRLARDMTAGLGSLIDAEELPGPAKTTDKDLSDYVRNQAWGHHASCTCPIGDRAHGGVLGSDFKVHGTEGLRVVDASVFPRIPGLFIVSAIYMIGEKAAEVIDAEARR